MGVTWRVHGGLHHSLSYFDTIFSHLCGFHNYSEIVWRVGRHVLAQLCLVYFFSIYKLLFSSPKSGLTRHLKLNSSISHTRIVHVAGCFFLVIYTEQWVCACILLHHTDEISRRLHHRCEIQVRACRSRIAPQAWNIHVLIENFYFTTAWNRSVLQHGHVLYFISVYYTPRY